MRSAKPTAISETLSLFKDNLVKRKKFVKNEFQAYGLELAKDLDDWKNKSLYIRLAKNIPREILEKAFYFVKDQNRLTVKSKARLFMWKLKELKKTQI
jgi:hypothetical protein